MLGETGWIALGIMALYLTFFAWGTIEAARAARRPIWLFGRARGTERLAALGFRLAFVLALLGPLLWLVFPMLHKLDPFWTEGRHHVMGVAGVLLAVTGAMLAFAAQMSMGASWRVGVRQGESGALVTGGLFRFSRNPTFVGQAMLLMGIALAIPSLPGLLAVLLFITSASVQIRTEERVLLAAHGAAYRRWSAQVPRWIGLRS
ncbi:MULTISPECIES: isoprenylcysteine carboxylmethyltransferase family protein [unclassified Paracoccus (in: a-proteobacteria)]|uniref:methyltransferase family protein n=1 Tax=Paracoccus TaxID=265 RepID=UPI000CD195CB|nr:MULTISPECIES: isoprenylcysteine carboxylmethyltransferase family protein [unclassified Paracoccus (in: a-proteobacteria)]MDQ1901949.1 isoprenylcysteine carboxylmethyltransferase family protein [Paracoccus sp. WLY502]